MPSRLEIAAAFGALGLLLACAGGPASGPADCPHAAATPARPATPAGLSAGDAVRGGELFAQHCTRCHSPERSDRESRLFRSYPRLDCGAWVAGVSDAYLYRLIAEGGAALGKRAVMKPFAEQLSAREISDLVAYLRAFEP